jgi:peptidoglycan hydrolase CwlO-like protein
VELLDRNHYRMREDSNLLEEAKYNPTAELAIILAERLDDVLLEADTDKEEAKEREADLQIDLNQLDDKIYMLQQEIDKLELMLGERDRIIDELKEQNND